MVNRLCGREPIHHRAVFAYRAAKAASGGREERYLCMNVCIYEMLLCCMYVCMLCA